MKTEPTFLRLSRALPALVVLVLGTTFLHASPFLSASSFLTRAAGTEGIHAGHWLPGALAKAAPDSSSIIWASVDTAADPHWKDFHYPIYLRNPQGLPVCDRASLRITVVFDATLFFIRSVSPGTIASKQLQGDSIVVDIDLSGTTPVTSGVVVELIGDVLDGREQSTQMRIRSVLCSGTPVTDSIYSGYMALGPGFCEQGSDRLINYTAPFSITKIVPNPASGAVTVSVTTMGLAETWLEIYAMDGRRVFVQSWIPTSMQQQDLMRDIVLPDDLPSGMYRMVLRSEARSDVQPLLINR